MSKEEQGIYISLMALAWDSDEPGTITLKPKEICREIGIYSATFRRFFRKFPTIFRKSGRNLIQPKLELQYQELIRFKENKSLAGQKGNAVRWHSDRSASATAPAPAKSTTTPLPPANAGAIQYLAWMNETIEIRMGRRRRLPKLEAYQGSMAYVVAEVLTEKGYPARIVREQWANTPNISRRRNGDGDEENTWSLMGIVSVAGYRMQTINGNTKLV
jgi:hypothetical protein